MSFYSYDSSDFGFFVPMCHSTLTILAGSLSLSVILFQFWWVLCPYVSSYPHHRPDCGFSVLVDRSPRQRVTLVRSCIALFRSARGGVDSSNCVLFRSARGGVDSSNCVLFRSAHGGVDISNCVLFRSAHGGVDLSLIHISEPTRQS